MDTPDPCRAKSQSQTKDATALEALRKYFCEWSKQDLTLKQYTEKQKDAA